MKKLFKLLIMILVALLASSCTVKQGQLVIVEEHGSKNNNIEENLTLNFNIMPQKISIENNVEILKKVDPKIIPLAVSSDTGIVIGIEFVNSKESDEINAKVVTGNMIQPVNMYSIDTNKNEKNFLGKFPSPKDFKFDETGKLFAFIDGGSNVYIYDTEANQLQKIIEGKNYYAYDGLNWSRDSKKLLIDQRMTFDISSKQMISFAVDPYNPYLEQKYNNQDIYIVQMKNKEYDDMIALYNFSSKSFKNLATGVFLDSDNVNLIYTKQNDSNLYLLNFETLESKPIETGPIFQAKIMKSTGDILYTTVNYDLTSSNRYLLIKLNPNTGSRKEVELCTPTFYLSPAEDMLYFVGDYNNNIITVNTADLIVSQKGSQKDDSDLFAIKAAILKMFQLDYNFEGSYEEYENLSNEVYANTYDPVAQEALENKLIDFKRFNMPLPSWQKEPSIPSTIVLNSCSIKGDRASVNIGFFYINSIELAKIDGIWKITGFSTHPYSKEVKEISAIAQKHINDIKNKNKEEALKYWKDDPENEFNKTQLQIVTDLMNEAASYNIEIGEIELWSLSMPHRAENPQTAVQAKVKVVLSSKESSKKYKLVLSRDNNSQEFSVESWSIDPLSVSQLY